MNEKEIEQKNLEFVSNLTERVIDWGLNSFKDKVFATTAFGMNGVVMLDFIAKKDKTIPIYFIDTGYHFKETLEIKDYYKSKGFNILEVKPEVVDNQKFLYEMGHDICCSINKVEPMRKIMQENKKGLWITAVARHQTSNRKGFGFVEPQRYEILKLSPMLAWRDKDIINYVEHNSIKYNELYNKGYASIGCKPCTTPIKSGESVRDGRWRGKGKEECGLHIRFNKSKKNIP